MTIDVSFYFLYMPAHGTGKVQESLTPMGNGLNSLARFFLPGEKEFEGLIWKQILRGK
jgi:hypothetical protein